jgi:hypothetical protein
MKLNQPTRINRVNKETTLNVLKPERTCQTCARREGFKTSIFVNAISIVKCEATKGDWELAPKLGVCSRWKMSAKEKAKKDKRHRKNNAKKRKIKKEEARAAATSETQKAEEAGSENSKYRFA